MRRTRIDIDCELLRKLYIDRGFTLLRIGKNLGYSARTVELRARDCNIKLRTPGLPGPEIGSARLKYLYLEKRLSSRKIAKIYGCAYSTIDNKIKKLLLPPRTLSSAHLKTKRLDFSNNLKEKAYLLGFRIGDLRVRRMYKNSETVLVDCGSTKIEQIRLIKSLFSKYGRVWIGKLQKNGKQQIECGLNKSFSFLLKKYQRFPQWITKHKSLTLSALAGFIDAEGSFFIGKGNKYGGFAVGNYNLSVLEQIQTWLISFGLKPRLFMGVRKGYTGKDGYSHKSDYWMVSIYRKRDLLLFTQKMLPYLKHKDRVKSAWAVVKNVEDRNNKYGFIGM